MVNTGWKCPLNVSQDSRRAVNNNHACYSFVDLNDIRRDDFHYAYIPTSGGIDSIRASPVIYAYNYNFNIPTNATIKNVYVLPVFQQGNGKKYGNVTKLKTLKLKTGSSLTDYGGVGNNLATDSFIQSVKIPIGSWTSESTWKKGDKYIFGGGGVSDWGVTLTPNVVNSTNFGCVFQVIGTEYKKWTDPYVAKLLMKVEYSTPDSVVDENLGISKQNIFFYIGDEHVTMNDNISSKKFSGLNVDDKDTGLTLKVKIIHEGQSGESVNISCSSDNLLLSDLKQKVYTFPSIHFNGDASAKEYTMDMKIYPGFIGGTQVMAISLLNQVGYVRFDVTGDTFSDMSDIEKQKYMSDGQFCKISNCKFYKNYAKVNGGAMYVTTEHFQYANNRYGTSSNANTVGSSGGVVNLWYNGEGVE